MVTNANEYCTCDSPQRSHVRPGVCYACWKPILEEDESALHATFQIDRFTREYLELNDPYEIMRLQKTMT